MKTALVHLADLALCVAIALGFAWCLDRIVFFDGIPGWSF